MLTSLSITLSVLAWITSIKALSVVCNSDIYGHPSVADSVAVAHLLPFLQSDPDSQEDAQALRIFAEPGACTPKFPPIVNIYGKDMVQIPRLWRSGTARMAILNYANTDGKIITPMRVAKWAILHSSAGGILQYCTVPTGTGGVWVVTDMNRNPFLAIYIFQSGSDFEEIVNQYMITGKGINPYNPRSVPLGPGNQGIGLNVTQEGAIVSLSSNVTLPLMNGSRLFSGSAEGVSSAGVPVGGAITPDPTLAA